MSKTREGGGAVVSLHPIERDDSRGSSTSAGYGGQPSWAPPDEGPYTFAWTSAFETGLGEVDDQHRQLVGIINAFGELVSAGRDPDKAELNAHFEQLRAYASQHFLEEETLMVAANIWPAYLERHRREHRYYIAELDRIARDGAMDDREAAQEVLRFLSSWLAHHILGIDQAMARQVARILAGASPEQAHTEEQIRHSASTEPLLAALNNLFQHVAARNEDLRLLNETLDQRVRARTRELSEAVRHLEQERASSQRLSARLATANRQLEVMAMTDVLSGLPNRRHAILQLQLAWDDEGAEAPVSVIMVDADHFKEVNDSFGHDAGDAVIIALARELRHAIRTDDVVCRMGGDEFLIICPRTDREGARQVAETLWRRIDRLSVRCGVGRWEGSVSVGVATRTPDMTDSADLIKAADEAVYQAKEAGRNRVVQAPRGPCGDPQASSAPPTP